MPASINKALAAYNDPALLLARLLIASMFAVEAYNKWTSLAPFAGFLARLGVPAPELMAPAVAALETALAILLAAGMQTRLVALIVAAFCIFTALLAHSNFGASGQKIFFFKNMAIAGGALALLVAGPGAYSADRK